MDQRSFHHPAAERPLNVQPPDLERATLGAHSLDSYEPLIGAAAVQRILAKAEALKGLRIAHVSSTFYGGGVTEILTPLTLLMNAAGIETSWHLIQGTPAFFSCTKMLHNALQGQDVMLSAEEKEIYQEVLAENSMRLHIEDSDVVIVHDPQPLPLVTKFAGRLAPWIWQCHVDLSTPSPPALAYLRTFIERYDLAVFSLPDYRQSLDVPQRFITPAIDPFSAKNCELSTDEATAILQRHDIPIDRPIVAQVSRFDRWKDPAGVIEAFRRARRTVDCKLVLLGSPATDDPEAGLVLGSLSKLLDEHVLVRAVDDPLLVNALQRRAAVVLQKSLREGFGLTVTEAMWKGAAVIGGDVGGIRAQIADGENGLLVGSIEEAADQIVRLLQDEALRKRLGQRARQSVVERYLLSHLLEEWIDTIAGLTGRH